MMQNNEFNMVRENGVLTGRKVGMLSLAGLLFLSALVLPGCARARRDTTGFAQVDTQVVDCGFEKAWQATKEVLREKKLVLYTRDKRGKFLVYTEQRRAFRFFTPHRTQINITLEEVSSQATKITIETLDQVYGVTLLTYPGWHDRKTSDHALAQEILAEIQKRVS